MEYGLIGEHLSHSFSKNIHEKLAPYTYELHELRPDELDSFMRAKEFKGINVTIPYKQAVIPYLDEISGQACSIGAVNTIVNRNGKLCGFNTDYFGMKSMIVGYNHHFGHNRSGDFNHLTPLHNELNFNLTQVEKFDMGCGKISSTEIRKMLTDGDVAKAAKLLDYQYFIIGQTDSTGAFAPNMPNKIIPGTGIYEIEIDNKLAQLIIDGDKNMIINDFNNCNQNIKITFKKRLG
jgi:hypothetical protein